MALHLSGMGKRESSGYQKKKACDFSCLGFDRNMMHRRWKLPTVRKVGLQARQGQGSSHVGTFVVFLTFSDLKSTTSRMYLYYLHTNMLLRQDTVCECHNVCKRVFLEKTTEKITKDGPIPGL